MKTKKKLNSVVSLMMLVVSISIGLAGCSSKTNDSSSSSSTTSSSAKETTTSSSNSAMRTVVDQDGTKVEIPQNVNKIADLWHANNQIVLLLGGADKLVATTENVQKIAWFEKVYPRIEKVTAPFSGDDLQVEELVKLSPDVVLSSNDDQIAAVRQAGLPAVKVMFQNFDDMRKTINLTADVIGGDAPDTATKYLDYLDSNIEYVNNRVKDTSDDDKPKVLHIVNGTNLLKVDGTNTIIDEWIKMAGGQNALTTDGNMIEVTMEEITKSDPDVIIVGSSTTDEAKKAMEADPGWANLRAVKEGKVYGNPKGTFPWDRYSAEEALQILWAAKLLHPDEFKDLDMVEKTKEIYSEFLNYNLTDEEAQQILDSEDPSK